MEVPKAFYQPKKSISIKAIPDKDVEDYRDSVPNTFPFASKVRNKEGVFHDIFSLITIPQGPSDMENLHLYHTPESRRSSFISETRSAFWGSVRDGYYNCVDIKGNSLEWPSVSPDPYHFGRYRINGLFDEGYALRAANAGEILRDNGVETEKIEMLLLPQELVWKGKSVSIEEFRKKLKETLPTPYLTPGKKSPAEELIDKFQPVIMVRSLQVPERVSEIEQANQGEIIAILENVFRYVNAKERALGTREHFSTNNSEDIKRYLEIYFPKMLGRNVGRMHRAKLSHGYLHTQNISLAGTFYDLDSVTGSPLKDEPITHTGVSKDVIDAVRSKNILINVAKNLGITMEHEIFEQNFYGAYLDVTVLPDAKVDLLINPAKLLKKISHECQAIPTHYVIEWVGENDKKTNALVRKLALLFKKMRR